MPTIKVLSGPIFVITFTGFLLIFIINAFLPRVRATYDNTSEVQKNIATLTNKVDILRSFETDVVSDRTDITYIVLPDSNPTAIVISQIKDVLTDQGILEPLGVSLSENVRVINDTNRMGILVEFSSNDLNLIIDAITKFQKFAPLISIENVKINAASSRINVEAEILIYWADLPQKLPELEEAVISLNTKERQILDRILTYNLPDFALSKPSIPSGDRINPFN